MTNIEIASTAHIDQLVPLFDAYRMFYKQDSNPASAYTFLRERINRKESVIFIAYFDDKADGFTQLFYSFSSVSLQPTLLLNDLYVALTARNKGVATSLLQEAKTYCTTNNFKGLALETAVTNPAQKLYEKLGWKKDSDCFHYFWTST